MTRDGVNNLEGIDDQSIWFRMVLVNTAQIPSSVIHSYPFHIDNNLPPSTTQILLPESEQNGDVTFNVVTSDQENDPIDILATYSLDGGFTWNSGSTEIINSQLTYSSVRYRHCV